MEGSDGRLRLWPLVWGTRQCTGLTGRLLVPQFRGVRGLAFFGSFLTVGSDVSGERIFMGATNRISGKWNSPEIN